MKWTYCESAIKKTSNLSPFPVPSHHIFQSCLIRSNFFCLAGRSRPSRTISSLTSLRRETTVALMLMERKTLNRTPNLTSKSRHLHSSVALSTCSWHFERRVFYIAVLSNSVHVYNNDLAEREREREGILWPWKWNDFNEQNVWSSSHMHFNNGLTSDITEKQIKAN